MIHEEALHEHGFGRMSSSEARQLKKADEDRQRLFAETWRSRKGHTLTYVGLFLFTFVLYFRPYEMIPALSGLNSIAMILAIATLLIYLPSQVATDGTLTALPTEVKCVLFLGFWALLTIPIAKDPSLAWEEFNEHFSKVIIIFVVMVNALRTPGRLKGLMWLAIGIAVVLSYQAINLYREGKFAVEGYRVKVDFGGMFGNPNDMAAHLVIFMPIAVALGLATRSKLAKILYFGSAIIMIGGILVTQSRGGFLGFLAASAVFAWKIGKGRRFKVLLVTAFSGLLVTLFAPGNYGIRILSIFIPALDPVNSAEQRRELFTQSIWVTLRNPWGIGIGNFEIVGVRNLVTHNAYTQVSAELGLLAFAAYLIFLISPLRKLGAVERLTFKQKEYTWIYFATVGVYASIAGYMVSSFFGSIAYNWYVYYPVAFAVGLRRIYQLRERETQSAAIAGEATTVETAEVLPSHAVTVN